jgi:Leucine-rich repeat (LRR) protein
MALHQLAVALWTLFILCWVCHNAENSSNGREKTSITRGPVRRTSLTPGLSRGPAFTSTPGRSIGPGRQTSTSGHAGRSTFWPPKGHRGQRRWRRGLAGYTCGEYLLCNCTEIAAFCNGYSADESLRTIKYIPQFPLEITHLKLCEFIITQAQLSKPDFFANVSQLIELVLCHWNIKFVRKEMFYGLKNLKVLSLHGSDINSFESMKEALFVPGLQYLDMSGNKISESPPENIFTGLQSTVTYLNLARNNKIVLLLYNLSEFAFLTELTALDLTGNRINSITTVRPLPNLVE